MKRVDAWMRSALTHMGRSAWPPCCALCGRPGQGAAIDLCVDCEAELPANTACCPWCANPLQSGTHMCGECLQRAPRFEASYIPFRYAYPMDHLIRRFKYGNAIALGRVLGELFARRLAQAPRPTPDMLIPVPLAHRRFGERGFNQALVLAQHIHAQTRLPLRTDVLVRTRDTPEQAGLDQRERRVNIRGAFALRAALPPVNVAIVDDVVTTGSTVNEVARVLKRAGAKRVEVWAMARAAR